MINKSNPFRHLTVAVFACLLAASCSGMTDDGITLPGGKYPMTFTSSVDGLTATRATTDNSWTGGEEVAIQIAGEVKKYAAAFGGSLTVTSGGTPFYWQSAAETKTVSAWYYGTGYNVTPPSGISWAVQPDQSKTESGSADDNYQRSDFLYAPPTDIPFSGRNSTSLIFHHQTARVVVNIVNAEAATDASAIQSVVIGDAANLALSGTYTAPTDGVAAGTWDTSSPSPTMGTIIPKGLATPGTLTDGRTTALASYAALVIPQQMKNKKFIAVTLKNGNTYYYTPAQDDDANLQSGKQHTYDITVKNGYLEVSTGTGGTIWGSGGTESVTGVQTFRDTDLKPGDYYYSDGNTSDGGYRKYSDGSTQIEDIQPVLTGGRTVIGIVLSVGYDGGKDDSQYVTKGGQRMSTIHGYVLALYDAIGGGTCKWGILSVITKWGISGITIGTNTDKESRFDGYNNTQIVKAYATKNGKTLKEAFPATYHATDGYEALYPAPTNSSGWSLPSGGQCKCWLDNRDLLLASVKKATGNSGYSWGKNYWSSSEDNRYPADNAWCLSFGGSRFYGVDKRNRIYVRAVLAF